MVAEVTRATFVREIEHGEIVESLVNEAKARAWENNAEHMALKIETGKRLMVRGGPNGISFTVRGTGDDRTIHMLFAGAEVRVSRIYGHTHPRVTGPSDGDLEALAILKQGHSYIFEIGGERDGTRIQPKPDPEG